MIVSVVEEFSGIDVDDMLRKKKQFFGHAFAYVFDLASHWNLLSTMRPIRRCSVTFSIF